MDNQNIKSTGCCEPLTSFLHIPLNMGQKIIKNMDLIEIRFYRQNQQYASRMLQSPPHIGESVRFHGVLYRVEDIVWCFDEEPICCNVAIRKISGGKCYD